MVFLFLSQADRDLMGFTVDKTGSNLPPEYAPWKPASGGVAIPLGGGNTSSIIEAVQQDGYLLMSVARRDEGTDRPTEH